MKFDMDTKFIRVAHSKINPTILVFMLLGLLAASPSKAQFELVPSNPMHSVRSSHRATLLNDGRVLIRGGYNGYSITGTEVFNPNTQQWTAAESLAVGRIDHTHNLLLDGRVLVTGGGTGSTALFITETAELFDPSDLSWSTASSMGTKRRSHTGTSLENGRVFVAGGFIDTTTVSSTEVYDPQTDSWSVAACMQIARSRHSATMLDNGKILVIGGSTSKVAELYDPNTNTWSSAGNISVARVDHTATKLLDGTVLIVGGNPFRGSAKASVELYDPQTNSWTTLPSLTAPRTKHSASLLNDGNVLISGGELGFGGSSTHISMEIYDTENNILFAAPEMKTTRRSHSSTALKDGSVLIAGGNVGTHNVNTTSLFRQVVTRGDEPSDFCFPIKSSKGAIVLTCL